MFEAEDPSADVESMIHMDVERMIWWCCCCCAGWHSAARWRWRLWTSIVQCSSSAEYDHTRSFPGHGVLGETTLLLIATPFPYFYVHIENNNIQRRRGSCDVLCDLWLRDFRVAVVRLRLRAEVCLSRDIIEMISWMKLAKAYFYHVLIFHMLWF